MLNFIVVLKTLQVKPMKYDTVLNIRVPQKEMDILKAFCQQEKRSQADVVREFLRSLKAELRESA